MTGAVKVRSVTVNGYSLLNIRLVFYTLAWCHLLVTAVVTLSVDMTVDEDPKVRAYNRVRWNLLTCWYNMICLVYLPLCIYIDWREKCGDESPQIDKLRHIRDVSMTAILFPVIAFADLLFWVLFKRAPWIIAPPRVFEYLPDWSQHSLHTISAIVVFIDLVLTPRIRPKSHRTNLALLVGFCVIYVLAIYVTYLLGDYVYSFIEIYSNTVCFLVYIGHILANIVFYYGQWYLIDYIWGSRNDKKSKEIDKLK